LLHPYVRVRQVLHKPFYTYHIMNKKWHLLTGGAIIIVACTVFFFSENTGDPHVEIQAFDDVKPNSSNSKTSFGVQSLEESKLRLPKNLRPFSQTQNELRNDPEEWFEEAKVLAQEGLDERVYIQQLHSLLGGYATITKDGGHPAGLNVEITNALLGKNSKRIALLSEEHPRINDLGELVDSWGTAYSFHNESLREISIRSAGPDKTLYTDDDFMQ